jgi:hypothetical protein
LGILILTLILTAMEFKEPILENGNKSCMTKTENVLKLKKPRKISQQTFLLKGVPQ